VTPTIPPRVDYELTNLGRTLLEPVRALAAWAERHRPTIQAARDRFDRSAAITASRNPRGDSRDRAQALG
jgi:DNA-binding HxlR family transcriptional regulator